MANEEIYNLDVVINVDDNAESGLDNAERRLTRVQKLIQKMNRTRVNINSSLKDKVTQNIEKMQRVIQSINQRGIILTAKDMASNALNKTKEKITDIIQKAKSFGSATYKGILTVRDSVTPQIRNIDNKIKTLSSNIINGLGGAFAKVGGVIATTFAGVGVVSSVKEFADFEQGMKNVQAVSGVAGADLKKLTDKAREMGRTTAFTATDSAKAMEYMAMAGWKTQDMIDGLPGILNLASAGGTDLAIASDIVTDGLTAMGLTAKDTDKFADIMASTISNANTNVEMMGETLKYVGPVAGSLGINMGDLSVAIGLMGNAGIKASQAGTSLRSGLNRLVNPTTDLAKALMDEYGIALKTTESGSMDLMATIDNLRSSLGGLNETTQASVISTIFGTDAMSGWSAIINATEEDFNKLSKAIAESEGKAKEIADMKLDTISGQFEILKSAVNDVVISIGEKLGPTTRKAIEQLIEKMPNIGDNIVAVVENIVNSIPKIQSAFNNFKNTIINLSPIILGFISALVTFRIINGTIKTVSTIAGAFSLLTNPIVLVSLAIGALVGAFIFAYQKTEFFRGKIQELMTILRPLGQTLMELGGTIINALSPVLEFIGFVLVEAISTAFNVIIGLVSNFVLTATTIFSGITTFLQGICDFLVGVFTLNWDTALNGIKNIVIGAVEFITGLWQGLIDFLTTPIQAFVDILDGIFKDKVNWIKDAWDNLRAFINNPIKGVVDIVKNVASKVTGKGEVKTAHATGGIFTNPHIALVAEESGGEAIIPLNSKRRDRAIGLWQETGKILGVDSVLNSKNYSSYAVGSVAGTTRNKDFKENNISNYKFEEHKPKIALSSGNKTDISINMVNNINNNDDVDYVVEEATRQFAIKFKQALSNIKV